MGAIEPAKPGAAGSRGPRSAMAVLPSRMLVDTRLNKQAVLYATLISSCLDADAQAAGFTLAEALQVIPGASTGALWRAIDQLVAANWLKRDTQQVDPTGRRTNVYTFCFDNTVPPEYDERVNPGSGKRAKKGGRQRVSRNGTSSVPSVETGGIPPHSTNGKGAVPPLETGGKTPLSTFPPLGLSENLNLIDSNLRPEASGDENELFEGEDAAVIAKAREHLAVWSAERRKVFGSEPRLDATDLRTALTWVKSGVAGDAINHVIKTQMARLKKARSMPERLSVIAEDVERLWRARIEGRVKLRGVVPAPAATPGPGNGSEVLPTPKDEIEGYFRQFGASLKARGLSTSTYLLQRRARQLAIPIERLQRDGAEVLGRTKGDPLIAMGEALDRYEREVKQARLRDQGA